MYTIFSINNRNLLEAPKSKFVFLMTDTYASSVHSTMFISLGSLSDSLESGSVIFSIYFRVQFSLNDCKSVFHNVFGDFKIHWMGITIEAEEPCTVRACFVDNVNILFVILPKL